MEAVMADIRTLFDDSVFHADKRCIITGIP